VEEFLFCTLRGLGALTKLVLVARQQSSQNWAEAQHLKIQRELPRVVEKIESSMPFASCEIVFCNEAAAAAAAAAAWRNS
jgi:hypothetical protein